MKKFALIPLLFIYSLSVFGIGIKQFYCCGKLESTAISFVQESKENCTEGEAADGCCKTTFKNLTIKDTYVVTEGINNPVNHFAYLHLFPSSLVIMPLAKKNLSIANASHAPPLYHNIPIYIFHCAYLI